MPKISPIRTGPAVNDFAAPTPTAKAVEADPPPTASATQSLYAKQLAAVPELEPYGAVLRSSTKPVALTESETEYVVGCVKHVFKENIVFQVSYCSLKPFGDCLSWQTPKGDDCLIAQSCGIL